ncbi:MAG: LysR family transcriptional regulator [Planctomycetota bacterium]
MNPAHLRTFLAVHRHHNFTRAAEELFISQPAVSRQMQQLEADLGVQLIEHIGKSLHLTPAGETLAREAETVLGDLERLAERVRAHRAADVGWLRIGASTTPGYFLLPKLLGEFHRRFSDVELGYQVDNSSAIEQLLVRNELDIGFIGVETSNPLLMHESVVDDEVVCFAAAGHPLARKKQIDTAELSEHVLVMRELGSATGGLAHHWLREHKVTPRRTIQLASPEAIRALVGAGVGYSFMSIHGLREQIDAGTICRVDVPGLRLVRPILIVRHRDKHRTPVMDAFLHIVREAGRPAGRR